MNKRSNAKKWIDIFEELRNFTVVHDDLVVTKDSLSIPQGLRDEFYDLLSRAQIALTAETLGPDVEQGLEVVHRCASVRNELVRMSGLKEFRLPTSLENLIADPETTLARPSFDIILNGLQQQLEPEDMEAQAARNLSPFCRTLFRNAYEAWAYYGIVGALEPVKFYGVFSPDTVEMRAIATDIITVGEQVTSPERRMPEAIFETRDGRLYAMKSEVARELDFYGQKVSRKRDCTAGGNTMDMIAHRVLLFYEMSSVDNIPMLANRDKQYLLSSDLMCEFMLEEELKNPMNMSLFFDRVSIVRSKRPVQLLTYDEKGDLPGVLCEKESELPPVERRVLGLEQRKLQEIAALLKNS